MDYLERRAAEIEAVTRADVHRVARRLIRTDDLIVVVVGDPAGIDASD
jgi:zinc protease